MRMIFQKTDLFHHSYKLSLSWRGIKGEEVNKLNDERYLIFYHHQICCNSLK